MMFYASLSLLLAPRAPPPRMMGRGPSFSEGQRLFVDNLSFDTDWQALKEHFISAGYDCVFARLNTHASDDSPRGSGVVQLATIDEASHALETMGGTTLGGRQIRVRAERLNRPGRAAGGAYAASAARAVGWRRGEPLDAACDAAAVEATIAERDELRRRQAYDEADALRHHLRAAHGVLTDDREREWWVEDHTIAAAAAAAAAPVTPAAASAIAAAVSPKTEAWKNKPWRRTEGSGDEDSSAAMRLDEEEVADILARRDALRDARRFDEADRLLSQLAAMHVYVDDGRRQRVWWVGSRADGRGRAPKKVAGASRASPRRREYWDKSGGGTWGREGF